MEQEILWGERRESEAIPFYLTPMLVIPTESRSVCYCQTETNYKTYLLILSTSTCGTWKETFRLSSSISQIIGLKYGSGMLRVKMWFKAPSTQKDLSWLLTIHKNRAKSLIVSYINVSQVSITQIILCNTNTPLVESQVLLQGDKNATLPYFYWAGGPTSEQVAQKGCAVSMPGDWMWLWATCSSWLCFELWGRHRWFLEAPATINHAVILWLSAKQIHIPQSSCCL